MGDLFDKMVKICTYLPSLGHHVYAAGWAEDLFVLLKMRHDMTYSRSHKCFSVSFLSLFIHFERERERARAREGACAYVHSMSGGWAEREGERESQGGSALLAHGCQHRALSQKLWDHDQNQNWELDTEPPRPPRHPHTNVSKQLHDTMREEEGTRN